jgi:hypothetical protein
VRSLFGEALEESVLSKFVYDKKASKSKNSEIAIYNRLKDVGTKG